MLLNTGDHMVVSDDLYGGTTTMWRRHTERNGITFTHVDSRDTANIKNAIRPNTKVRSVGRLAENAIQGMNTQ